MSIKINIGEILTKAWQITWKFKILWIFGILASCSGGSRGNANFPNGSNNGGGSGSSELPDAFRQFGQMDSEQAVRALFNQYMGLILGIILLMCVLWLVFYFVGVMGRTGLIKGAGQADDGAESMSFSEIWSDSLPYFWRMFGLNLLVGLPFFLLTILILGGVLLAGYGVYSANGIPSEGAIIAMILGLGGVVIVLMCIIGILGTIVNLIVEQVRNAIVLEDLGVMEGFGRGWEVFSKNWLSVVLVGIILWVVGIVVGIVIAIPIVIAVIPLAIGIGVLANDQSWALIAAISLACCAIALPISLLLTGIQETYFQSVWTLAYRRLTVAAPPAAPSLAENLEPQ